jgi:hypothetical protein
VEIKEGEERREGEEREKSGGEWGNEKKMSAYTNRRVKDIPLVECASAPIRCNKRRKRGTLHSS